MLLYITKNINPNYNIIPSFVEKNPKITFKICAISKLSVVFYFKYFHLFLFFSKNLSHFFLLLLCFLELRTLLNHPKSYHYDPKQQVFKIQMNKIP